MKFYSKPKLKELDFCDIILASGETPSKTANVDGKKAVFSPEGTDVIPGAIKVDGNENYFLNEWKK